MSIDLQKIEHAAPELVSLTKAAGVSLAKAELSDHRAQVALCLDISGSMYSSYANGAVQKLAERVLALGLHFDDNQAIDVWLFNTSAHAQGEMGLANFREFIGVSADRVGGGTSYAPVIRAVREHYFGSDSGGLLRRLRKPEPHTPVYCMFVTDGAPFDPAETERQIQQSSKQGLFWQFMALGRRDNPDFAFLRNLDEMPGRAIDNANFFAVDSAGDIDDATLYTEMMREYPNWLELARNKGLIP